MMKLILKLERNRNWYYIKKLFLMHLALNVSFVLALN